jgi:outer membrane protein assembly factor BamB
MKLSIGAFFLLYSAFGSAADWPQWRGPGGRGVSEEQGLLLEWSESKNILWKTPLPGRGHSSPVVVGNRVFVTTDVEGEVIPGAQAVIHIRYGGEWKHPDSVGADRQHTLKVYCLDAASGRIVWERTAYEGAVYDNRHRKSTYASPTPVSDGRAVYAYFGSEGLYAYDLEGKPLWKASLGRLKSRGLSVGSSPVLFGDLILLQRDEDDGENSALVAVDKRTGKEVWRTPRSVQQSYGTPVLVRAGERTELVAGGNEATVAYDPASGKELWKGEGVRSNAVPSPVAGAGLVFSGAGYPRKRLLAFRPGGSGELAWKYEKGTAYVVSPLVYGDYLYVTTDSGILTCLDAKTGEVKYDNGRLPVPAKFTSSPVAAGGVLLMTSEDGDTFVIKAGPEHAVLGTNSVGEPVFASPAIAGGRIFIRGASHLFAIGAK